MEFLSEFFYDVWWCTTIKLKTNFQISNALDEIPFKTCFFCICLTMNA
jgi:hypothetical protein